MSATSQPQGNQNLDIVQVKYPTLSPSEVLAQKCGADVAQYIAQINNGRSHEEAITLAGGQLQAGRNT